MSTPAPRPRPPRDLRASRLQLQGERYVVVAYTPEPTRGAARLPRTLTVSERVVHALLMAGLSDAEIARVRGTTRSTVTKQVDRVFRKLGVRSRRELIARYSTQRA